jgi:ferredoxin-NADP reductase
MHIFIHVNYTYVRACAADGHEVVMVKVSDGNGTKWLSSICAAHPVY